jgi:small ligand-binding sensory domain FIST
MTGKGADGTPQPPLNLLRDLIASLREKDRELVQHSLLSVLLGISLKCSCRPGDFLIRNAFGVESSPRCDRNRQSSSSEAADQVHLRNADTSALDLELLLQAFPQEKPNSSEGTRCFALFLSRLSGKSLRKTRL